jgi:hypothetical protein
MVVLKEEYSFNRTKLGVYSTILMFHLIQPDHTYIDSSHTLADLSAPASV